MFSKKRATGVIYGDERELEGKTELALQSLTQKEKQHELAQITRSLFIQRTNKTISILIKISMHTF